MSKKQTEEQSELSWEEAVSRYLADHPDFFARYPELLTSLDVPHPVEGRAVSLIERQVAVLRDKHGASQRQLRDLIKIARENEALGERVHRFALAVTDCATLDDLLDTTQDMLRREFRLDTVNILLKRRAHDTSERPEFVRASDRRYGALVKLIGTARTLCESRLDADLLDYLFGRQARAIKSTALIPLGGKMQRGILVLGAEDPERFQPEMGTVYLVRLGELFSVALVRFLA